MSKGEHLLVMMHANTRTDRREEECFDGEVFGIYGRYTLITNGR